MEYLESWTHCRIKRGGKGAITPMKNMKNRYLVADPIGVLLVRCNSEDECIEFITNHCNRSKEAYHKLGVMFSTFDYQIRDLMEIPTYSAVKKLQAKEQNVNCK